ncbi:putative tetratricopeptide-like helical domain-containing protein [Medicago truncatula]|uniref:Putative tetratricopeptide-like helical domain-containing protein n=1 Tax=Medicago truncatula TaxID=3880 RepID=A0A396J8M8_MEDTR|nr:putative tetratricopeptide-like helical domain-containing protein [Medicago truncatula]
MITAYGHSRGSCVYGAFNIASIMQQQGLLPNQVTLVSLMDAAAKLVALQEGRAVHGYAVRRGIGLGDDVFETTLLDMYHKCAGCVGLAASVFAKMDARKRTKVGSWNTLIAGYLRNGQALEAFELFRRMMCRNILPDLLTLANVIFCCVELNYLHRGKSIHGYMIMMGVELDLVASTALVDLYCKIDVTKARMLFERLENKDAVVYNVMMSGYLENNLPAEALNVFCEMVKMNVSPNVALFINLISAVSKLRDIRLVRSIHGYVLKHMHNMSVEIANQFIHAYAKCGYVVDEREVFNKMRTMDLVSWNSMIMGYVHNDHIDEAALSQLGCLSFVKEIHCFSYRFVSYNLQRHTIWSKACPQHTALLQCLLCFLLADYMGDTDIGEAIGKQILELEPHSSGAYALVSNICAQGGRWDEVAQIRAMTKNTEFRTTPGYIYIYIYIYIVHVWIDNEFGGYILKDNRINATTARANPTSLSLY